MSSWPEAFETADSNLAVGSVVWAGTRLTYYSLDATKVCTKVFGYHSSYVSVCKVVCDRDTAAVMHEESEGPGSEDSVGKTSAMMMAIDEWPIDSVVCGADSATDTIL